MRYDPAYYSHKDWREFRRLYLLGHPVCTVRGCNEDAKHIDHIVTRREGGAEELHNYQGLCHSHHSAKTVARDGGFGRAPVQGFEHVVKGADINGRPRDLNHPWNR